MDIDDLLDFINEPSTDTKKVIFINSRLKLILNLTYQIKIKSLKISFIKHLKIFREKKIRRKIKKQTKLNPKKLNLKKQKRNKQTNQIPI